MESPRTIPRCPWCACRASNEREIQAVHDPTVYWCDCNHNMCPVDEWDVEHGTMTLNTARFEAAMRKATEILAKPEKRALL